MVGFDARQLTQPLFTLQATEQGKACTSASFSPHFGSMLATVGADNLCKVWDISAAKNGVLSPSLVSQRNTKQGSLFSVQMYKDIPWVLATGGSSGDVTIWDTEEDLKIK